MIPNALENLIHALTNSAEYLEMQRAWAKISGDAVLYGQMLKFEKEESELSNNTPQAELFSEKAKLRSAYKEFLEHADIQGFISAAGQYRKMVETCITKLWDTFKMD